MERVRSFAASLARRIGMDRAVRWRLFTQGIRFATGPITLFLLVRYLTPETQGYAYTFMSVIGLSVFLELGFSQNILQFTSHEFSRLKLEKDSSLSGDADSLSRLVSLGRLSFTYFCAASLLLFAGLSVAGEWLFQTAQDHQPVAWRGPWMVAVAAASLSLLISPCWALIEGCNQIARIERFRFWSSLGAFLLTASLLVANLGLYALVIPSLGTFLLSLAYLLLNWRAFFATFLQAPSGPVISWKKEIWPFQWRIAISWISGYFIFSIATPIVFRLAGPAEAGRFGFTLQLTRTIGSMAGSWCTTKLPLYGMLVARRDWNQLNALWKRVTTITLIVATAGSVALLIGMEIASDWYPRLSTRYAGAGVASILCVSMICQSYTASGAYFLRAFKSEPYMVVSLFNAALSMLFIPAFTWFWGVAGAAIGYTLAIFITAWPAHALLVRKRNTLMAE